MEKILSKSTTEGMRLAMITEPFIPFLSICQTDMKHYGKLYKYAYMYDLDKNYVYLCAVGFYDELANMWSYTDVELIPITDDERNSIKERCILIENENA